MIEFCGEQSTECKLLLAKKKSIKVGLIFSICSIILSIITLIIGILNNKIVYSIILIVILFLLSLSMFLMPKKRIENIKINSKIIINKNIVSMFYSTNFHTNRLPINKHIQKIKKIYDYGICYCIIFNFGDITNAWVCEKKLISKGSITEFENIFKDKIIRKLSKNITNF